MTGYKIFTHDYCSPLQGGKAVWDGSVPFQLPPVALDTSEAECAAGWNFCESIEDGFQIAGMWLTGRSSVVAVVEANGDAIKRGNKWRASAPKIVGLASEVEICKAIERFSKVFIGAEAEMASEQIAWRYALSRPENNKAAVVEALEKALAHRGLKWELKEHANARDAWAAWAALDAWDALDARVARDAWDARDALTVFYAAKKRWIKEPADLLTTGLREAYANGLEIALPISSNKLGWSMKP